VNLRSRTRRVPPLSWIAIAVLAMLCGLLGVLQYRWTGEISSAQKQQIEATLSERLASLQLAFNARIASACPALTPGPSLMESAGPLAAYAAQYLQWKPSSDPLFRRIALAAPSEDSLELYNLDLETARFAPADWPAEWSGMRARLLDRLDGRPPGFGPLDAGPFIIECPRFGPMMDWLLLELDSAYLSQKMLPEFLNRYLADSGKLDYDAEVVTASHPSEIVYQALADARHPIGAGADATIALIIPTMMARNPRRGPPPDGPAPDGPGPPGFHRVAGPRPPPPEEPGIWVLRVRHRAGSLEALVAGVRLRNLGVSCGLLMLILATGLMLVRYSRRAHQLVELQMNFVAGVSHELRTPLTVIHTAAFNLRGKLAHQPDQVEQYGALIQRESAKLSSLVDQILQFAGAGRAPRKQEAVAVERLVELALAEAGDLSQMVIEKQIEPGLPPVTVDAESMTQVLRNLIENAVKYGGGEKNWIGIAARGVSIRGEMEVEIAVSDHGPGIPADELESIFDPFFRGKKAIDDQIHGTGLGLNLVKRIVEAHGGSLRVESVPGRGATFLVRLSAAGWS
jgi:signal transduction histidine kinase